MDSLNFEILINNIGQLAKRRGISRNKALMDSGAGKDFVTNTISKGQIPSILKIAQLANYFNVSIDYLLTGEEKSSSPELTEADQNLLEKFNTLTEMDKELVFGFMDEIYAKYTPRR